MPPHKILVFQTAFLGDVVLTLPLVQSIHRKFPSAQIDFVATPAGAEALRNHPALRTIIVYDKRGRQRGLASIVALARVLRHEQYDVALVPHRSLRSAVIAFLSRIPVRAGFDTSAGAWLFSKRIEYRKDSHEIERNLSFTQVLGFVHEGRELPLLYPSASDIAAVDRFFQEQKLTMKDDIIGMAPGSVWNTKRWLPERFAEAARKLAASGRKVVLVGGTEDAGLCGEIAGNSGAAKVVVAAGKLTILQSAEILRRCSAVVANDTAPMHFAVAMRTPVVAIFGATVPSFGFSPYGEGDLVVQTEGLACRPCSIHGGDQCPIGTFECMKRIEAETVCERALQIARPASKT